MMMMMMTTMMTHLPLLHDHLALVHRRDCCRWRHSQGRTGEAERTDCCGGRPRSGSD